MYTTGVHFRTETSGWTRFRVVVLTSHTPLNTPYLFSFPFIFPHFSLLSSSKSSISSPLLSPLKSFILPHKNLLTPHFQGSENSSSKASQGSHFLPLGFSNSPFFPLFKTLNFTLFIPLISRLSDHISFSLFSSHIYSKSSYLSSIKISLITFNPS